MATDPRERELAAITETLFGGGYDGTEGQDGSRDTTWTDFGVVCGFAQALSAELVEARAETERLRREGEERFQAWVRLQNEAAETYSRDLVEARRERDDAQARLARLANLTGEVINDLAATCGCDDHVRDVQSYRDDLAALSGGVAAETRDGERCPTCGGAVRVHTSDEGTSFYVQARSIVAAEYDACARSIVSVGARREPEEPRE